MSSFVQSPPANTPGRSVPEPAQEATSSGADAFPASWMQESLWLLDQIAPGNPAYNLAEAWRLRGRLDGAALRQSWDALLCRHETLRTAFSVQRNQIMQVISAPSPGGVEQEDLCATADPEASLQTRLAAQVRRPFNLRTGRLARAVLFKLAENDHALLIHLHHVIADETSLAVLTRDLAEFYTAALGRRRASLPPLLIQYADFAVWQREALRQKAAADLDYWKQQLRGPLPALELRLDHPRPATCSFKGGTQFSRWGAELQRLKELSRRQGVTLFMTLLAAFKVLLHRHTRQTDLVVGSPMAGRDRTETENLVGLFVNIHALRTDLSGDPTFLELLSRVREMVLGATAHQSASVDQVIEAVQPARNDSRHPLFQVVFGLQPTQVDEWKAPGLSAQRIEVENGGSKFDWTLLLTETANGLKLRSEFNSDLFEPATVERLVRRFGTLVTSILQNPAARISRLRLFDESERVRLLSEGNQGPMNPAPSLSGGSIHAWFEARAKERPQAIAAVFGEQKLSYGELDRRASMLAKRLRDLGAGPGIPVALCLERSLDAVVAILGTLKAGSAYVPIDPAYPQERLRFILEDTRAPVVITQKKLLSALGEMAPAKAFCLDAIGGETASGAAASGVERPSRPVGPDDPAYIIYTSGSTGRPKGVIVTHGNVIRLFQQTEPWFGFNAADVWTLFHSISFDFSVWELWGALLYGGRLVVVPYLTSRSPVDFYKLLAREGVTVLNQTPSAFRQLIRAEESCPQALGLCLRYVIFGGEALELQTLKPWFARHGEDAPRLVNMYGITETTVHVTYRVVRPRDVEQGLGSVIGVPIPDLKLYLLDAHLELVPEGVPGEICVGGGGVAAGYLNRPELTAQRFVPDPFSSEPGARLYRSGDLAVRAGGELVYLGRMDHQVKIRGFRVETGEIESALNSHPAIRESIVVAQDGPGGEKRLAGYFVSKGQAPDDESLREHLARRLPDYMLPAVFVPLAELPLTSNGKVDRQALPAAAAGQAASERARVAPRNTAEAVILEIWKEILGRQEIGVEDNFFHMGGHSLLAMQVISRLDAALGVDLSVAALFETPTVAGLARAAQGAEPRGPAAGEIQPLLPATQAGQLLSTIDELSDAEVEQWLTRISKLPLSS